MERGRKTAMKIRKDAVRGFSDFRKFFSKIQTMRQTKPMSANILFFLEQKKTCRDIGIRKLNDRKRILIMRK